MSNNVVIQFRYQCGETGQYSSLTFGQDIPSIPTIERNTVIDRVTDQGYATSYKVPMKLKGFIEGNDHLEIMTQYNKLKECFFRNDLLFSYSIDGNVIYQDVLVYVDSYTEPDEWKQFNGDFSVNFHFFENPCIQFEHGIRSYYTNKVGEIHVFEPVPYWEANIAPSRTDINTPMFTYAGELRASLVNVNLTGSITADSPAQLKTKMDEMKSVFKYDGQLMYNGFQRTVRINSGLVFDKTFPHHYATYSIGLSYYDTDIEELEVERKFSEPHTFLKITNRLYCGIIEEEEFMESGQFIDYSIVLKSSTRQKARTALKNEFNKLLIPGGKLVPGGSETWPEGNKVDFKTTYFYKTPVLNSITDQDPTIPITIESEGT